MKKITKNKQVKDGRFGYWKGTEQSIYEHPADAKTGILPLFRYKIEILDIDLTRIESVDDIELKFTRKAH